MKSCTCPVDPDGLGAIFGASFGQFLNVLAGGKADPRFQIFRGHFLRQNFGNVTNVTFCIYA